MTELLITALFLLVIGIISARLYNKNVLSYFYFVIIIFYILPYLTQFLQILPHSMTLAYFPVIIFPFLSNTKLMRNQQFIIIFLIYSFLVFIIISSNFLLFFTGIIRYIYFFMILVLFYKTGLNQEQVNKLVKLLLIIALIQLPVNLINMVIFKHFHYSMSFYDSAGGTFGAYTSGILGVYTVLCIYILAISKEKMNLKTILIYLLLFLNLSLTYSGGAGVILFAFLIFLIFRPPVHLKKSLLSILIILCGFYLFSYTHRVMLEKFQYRYERLPQYSLTEYTMDKLLNIKSIIPPESSLDIRSQGRSGTIRNAFEFAEKNSSILVGAGVGSLNRAGALENIFNLADISGFNEVFRYNPDYVNSYAISIGEVGIIGFILIFYFVISLLMKKIKYTSSYKRKVLYYSGLISFVTFLLYSFYESAIYSFQFLFIWSFITFNIEKILNCKIVKNKQGNQ